MTQVTSLAGAARAGAPPLVVSHARIAGALLLLLPIPFAVIDRLASGLVVPGDVEATASQILASESLFRLGIVRALVLQIVDVIVLFAVFLPLLRPVNANLAVLMAALNLLGVPIAMLNELNQFAILLVLHGADSSHAALSLFLSLHDTGGLIASLFYGLWLVPYAVLVFRSGFLPRLFAVLLIVECLGFLVQSFTGFLAPTVAASLAILPTFTTLVELFLPLWMLIKAIDIERWERWTSAPA